MSASDLTTLARCKLQITPIPNDDDDTFVKQLITEVSSVIYGFLNRDSLLSQVYNDWYDGPGRNTLMLRQYPVTSVSALNVGSQSIPKNPNPPNGGSGFFLEPWTGSGAGRPQIIVLSGYAFYQGNMNVNVSYTAGYLQANEPATVPGTPFKVTPKMTKGQIAADAGVVYAVTGQALVAVASSPTQGQYIPPDPLADGTQGNDYTFAAADTGANILISYSYIPQAVEKACIDCVAERYAYRGRIGQRTKSLGGQETASYDLSDMPAFVKTALSNYRQLVPIM